MISDSLFVGLPLVFLISFAVFLMKASRHLEKILELAAEKEREQNEGDFSVTVNGGTDVLEFFKNRSRTRYSLLAAVLVPDHISECWGDDQKIELRRLKVAVLLAISSAFFVLMTCFAVFLVVSF